MERRRERVTHDWPGPLPARGLPEGVLYNARLVLRHDAGGDAARVLAASLKDLAGAARRMWFPFLAARVRASGPRWRIDARLRGDTIDLRVAHRLKGGALRRLVTALAVLPGAADLRLVAEEEHFTRPFASVGPCSPCAARSFGR